MRGLGGTLKDIDVREIDGLFASLDTNHSGEIDTAELKFAIKRMQREAQEREAEAAHARETAARLHQVADLFRAAAEVRAELEDAEQLAEAIEADKSIDARLGEVLRKRNVKIGEVPSGGCHTECHGTIGLPRPQLPCPPLTAFHRHAFTTMTAMRSLHLHAH